MSDSLKVQASLLAGLLCSVPGTSAWSFDAGFFAQITIEASDNVERSNSPDEQEGSIQSGLIGVYGQQRGTRLDAAFTGELDFRKVVSNDSSDINSITRFLGAAEFKITPRSWRWYVGDILGGVRNDSGLIPVDDNDSQVVRRNVLVTGPSFEYDIQGVSRTRARLLYVNQTQSNDNDSDIDSELETLITANFSYERDTTSGSFYGFRLGNVFTDLPQEQLDDSVDVSPTQLSNPDFNRFTFGLFYNKAIAFTTIFAEVGATRYDADDESLDGLNARLRVTRRTGPLSEFSIGLSRDLNDQSLNAVESLIENGENSFGLQRASGFFTETQLLAAYRLSLPTSVLDISAGVSDLRYQLISGSAETEAIAAGEDRQSAFAAITWNQRLSNRFRTEFGFNAESQDFENRNDFTDSFLASLHLIFSLSTSFDLSVGLTHNQSDGLSTQFNNNGEVGREEIIDFIENRASIGVRWIPPSRASRELTVELKSLLR